MNSVRIDINSDLGEGIGYDAQLMPLLSSCNIACGGHYGNKTTISETLKLAKEFGLNVGAHPSYPDQLNFGRKSMTIDQNDLSESIYRQVMVFQEVCLLQGLAMSHVKLHGALYNDAAQCDELASLVLNALQKTKLEFSLFVPYGSLLAEKAKSYFQIANEAFIDRTYQRDLSLVNRNHPEALINDPVKSWTQLYTMVHDQKVMTISGEMVPIQVDTFCIHGDSISALESLTYINRRMAENQIELKL